MACICALLLPSAQVLAGEANGAYAKVKPERAAVIERLEAGATTAPAKLPWRLFVPALPADGSKLPLVVFLHGAGRRGTDNLGPMELAWNFITPEAQARHPCFVVAPQVRDGRRWVDQDFNKGSYDADAVLSTEEMQATLALVGQLVASRPIDAKRLYVVGQSMGGYGAWDALVRRPDLWAAGVPICGAGDPSRAGSIKTIPVWAWHGENDTAVPVAGSREMIAALRQTGAQPQYTEIAKGGHGVWNPALADAKLYDWLFAQRRP
ncbi:MAG: prolyl oligopeptidase family serine peptidase [Planctomycetes bacterium]|nr:prolyl oligopeptidase family serine peptidase [Planctomycetota bacterium]